jgi:hypothetical protein
MALIAIGSLLILGADFTGNWDKLRGVQPESYVCQRGTDLAIDGRLDESSWSTAPWTKDFQDIEGGSKPTPRFRTRAKMLWDDAYFYVAAELEEPHVWGTLTNHDAVIFQDPDFEVFVDPDGDRHNYYEFEINALNTGWDLILKKPYIDGGPALNEWEIPGLKTAVRIQGTLNNATDRDRGWTVEIAFPWAALREFSRQKAPPAEGDAWRINFSRVEWQIEIRDGQYQKVPGTKEDNWVWSPMGIVDMHRPENWGYVKFTRPAEAEEFRRDARADKLLGLYYLQKDFYAKNKRWATSLNELGNANRFEGVTLQKSSTGFEAMVGGMRICENGLLLAR